LLRENPYIRLMSNVSDTVSSLSGAPICTLDLSNKAAIERHLLALGDRDRYLRFGYAATDEHIHRYVESIRFDRDEVFGIFNRDLNLIAMAHLAYAVSRDRTHAAESRVSVSPHARGRGYGNLLFARAVMHSRNHGVSIMHIHALSENAVMLGIARKAGASIGRDGSESEAHLRLPPADFESQLTELLAEKMARTNYQLKAHARYVRKVLKWVERLRAGVRSAGKWPGS